MSRFLLTSIWNFFIDFILLWHGALYAPVLVYLRSAFFLWDFSVFVCFLKTFSYCYNTVVYNLIYSYCLLWPIKDLTLHCANVTGFFWKTLDFILRSHMPWMFLIIHLRFLYFLSLFRTFFDWRWDVLYIVIIINNTELGAKFMLNKRFDKWYF